MEGLVGELEQLRGGCNATLSSLEQMEVQQKALQAQVRFL